MKLVDVLSELKRIKSEDVLPIPIDQGFSHHIVTYRTNTVFINRNKFSLDVVINQVESMIIDESFDAIFFNA